MGKTRDLIKEIGDIKGTFHARMFMMKHRNVRTQQAEEIKKTWQECTENPYQKGLDDPDNHDGVVTHMSQTSWSVKSSGP